MPGKLILRIAHSLYSPARINAVFAPAIADFHAELREADGPVAALFVRARWVLSLLVLLALTAFVPVPRTAARAGIAVLRPDRAWVFLVLAVALYAAPLFAPWALFQYFVAGALATGAVFSFCMARWHRHHSGAASGAEGHLASGEINLASIPVTDDAAGLLFAIGSVCLVVVGLADLWWYFAAAAVGSVVVAAGLLVLHASRPSAAMNSIRS